MKTINGGVDWYFHHKPEFTQMLLNLLDKIMVSGFFDANNGYVTGMTGTSVKLQMEEIH